MNITSKLTQTLSTQIILFAQAFIATPIIIKSIGADNYGEFILLTTFATILHGLSSFGIGSSARRKLPSENNKDSFQLIFYEQFNINFLTLVLLIILFNFIYHVYDSQNNYEYFVSIYIISYYIFSQTTDYFRYSHNISLYNLSNALQPALFTVLVVTYYIFFKNIEVNTLFILMIFSSTLVSLFFYPRISKHMKYKWVLPNVNKIKSDIKIGFPYTLYYVLDVGHSVFDRYIIAFLISVYAVGIYSPGYSLGSLILLIPRAIGVIIPNFLIKLFDDNKLNQCNFLINFLISLYLSISIAFAFGSLMLGRPILELYSTPEIAAEGWFIIPIVSFANIFYGLYLIAMSTFYVSMDYKKLLKCNFYSVIINMALNFILIGIFNNIIFSAVSTFLSYAFSLFYILKVGNYKIKIKFNLKIILISLFSSSIMCIGIMVFKIYYHYSSYYLFLQIFLGIIINFSCLFLFKYFRNYFFLNYKLLRKI